MEVRPPLLALVVGHVQVAPNVPLVTALRHEDQPLVMSVQPGT